MPTFSNPLSPPLVKGEEKGFLPFDKGELEGFYCIFLTHLKFYLLKEPFGLPAPPLATLRDPRLRVFGEGA